MVVHACHPNTRHVAAGESVEGQPQLYKRRPASCFLLLAPQQGLPSLGFCAPVLIRGSHLIFTITGARELGQATKVPQGAAGSGWGTTGCPGALNAPQDVTESWPCGGGGLPSVPLEDVTGSQAVSQRPIRQQQGYRGHRTARGHPVWASGQLWALGRTEERASGWCWWERLRGRVQDPELLAEGICYLSSEQGHQAPVQA